MRCAEPGPNGEQKSLDFRLTIGRRKIDGRWNITHEHHSIPAVNYAIGEALMRNAQQDHRIDIESVPDRNPVRTRPPFIRMDR
jgi:hypothetical protein